MRVNCHLPTSIPRPDDLSNAQFDLLQWVILRAVQRAVSRLDLADRPVEMVPHRQQPERQQSSWDARADGIYESALPRVTPMPDERGSSGEMVGAMEDEALVVVLLPTEEAGALVVMDGTAEGRMTSQGDALISEQFPWVPVVERGSASAVYAGGSPYVRTDNLTRAMQWGSQLFASSGFAILQSQTAPSAGDFSVISLLPSIESGGDGSMEVAKGSGATSEAVLLHPEGYATVTVAQSEGPQLFGEPLRDLWDAALFKEILNTSAMEQDQVDQRKVSQEGISSVRAGAVSQRSVLQTGIPFAQAGTTGLPATYVDEEMIALIASMERTVFAAMPAEKRRECLILMINAWNDERDEQTIIEILHAAQDASELRMLLALLRQGGLYEQLFGKLTEGMYELLEQVGASQAEQTIDWRYLVEALLALGIELPEPRSQSTLADLQQAAAVFANLLEQAGSEGLTIVTRSGVAGEVQELTAFFGMVQQARAGDPDMQSLLTNLVSEACTVPAQAMRGLEAIEQLDASYRQDAVEMGTAGALRQSLYIASIVVTFQQFMTTRGFAG